MRTEDVINKALGKTIKIVNLGMWIEKENYFSPVQANERIKNFLEESYKNRFLLDVRLFTINYEDMEDIINFGFIAENNWRRYYTEYRGINKKDVAHKYLAKIFCPEDIFIKLKDKNLERNIEKFKPLTLQERFKSVLESMRENDGIHLHTSKYLPQTEECHVSKHPLNSYFIKKNPERFYVKEFFSTSEIIEIKI